MPAPIGPGIRNIAALLRAVAAPWVVAEGLITDRAAAVCGFREVPAHDVNPGFWGEVCDTCGANTRDADYERVIDSLGHKHLGDVGASR